MATTKEVRVNDRIRIPSVRVIGPDGEQVGILGIREALAYAQERQLDLVEVSPTAKPPVCRVMDFGKFKYEQNKKQQRAKRKQHVTHLKEVKLRPKIEEHDYRFKVEHGRRFLELHDKVKFTVTFRGRELAHPEAGHRLLEKVVKDLETVGQVEIPARMEGRSLVLLMVPRPTTGRAPERKPAGVTGSTKQPSAAGQAKQPSSGSSVKQPPAAGMAKQNAAAAVPKQPTTKP
ncbi:MAG TPA: translation initiation factor IF-3 [Candidatus Eisenbacteria bacterium]|nr:translation initiation factor IF-3 [Candidatus Eisenbacteria bacterium]